MSIAYLAIAISLSAILVFSGIGKLRHNAHIVAVIHDLVGVPMKYFPLLAACELLGAAGLLVGIWWPALGIAAGLGLVLYFLSAVVSHLRVGDVKGLGPAAFLLAVSAGSVVVRVLAHR